MTQPLSLLGCYPKVAGWSVSEGRNCRKKSQYSLSTDEETEVQRGSKPLICSFVITLRKGFGFDFGGISADPEGGRRGSY